MLGKVFDLYISFVWCSKTNIYSWHKSSLHFNYIFILSMKTKHFTKYIYYCVNLKNQNNDKLHKISQNANLGACL